MALVILLPDRFVVSLANDSSQYLGADGAFHSLVQEPALLTKEQASAFRTSEYTVTPVRLSFYPAR